MERLRTGTHEVWLEDGVLRGKEDPGTETTLPKAKAVIEMLHQVSGGVRYPLIMDIRESKSVSREARAYLSGDAMGDRVTMLALVVHTALSRALGSFFLTFNRPKFTTKIFTSIEDALAWIRSQS
jgi:hypothetical protein